MSTFDEVLIGIAVVVLLSVGAVYFRRLVLGYIQHHQHPNQARLRVLWAELLVVIACTTAYSVGEGVTLARGEDKAPAFAIFWAALFAWLLIGIILKIRRCRKIVASHDA